MLHFVFEDYSQKREFAKAVREVVSDEFFCLSLLDKYNITRKQEKTVRKIVQEKLNNYIDNQMPNHISNFLNNNLTLNGILTEHENKLKNNLSLKSREILDQITNEEQYHHVTNSYIKNIENRFNGQLLSQNNAFHDFLLFSEEKINNEMALLKETNKKLKLQENEIWYLKYGLSLTILTGFLYAIFPSGPTYVSF